jgi:hypothetical protein
MNQKPESIDKCLKTPRAAAIDRLLVHRRGPRPLGRLNQWIFGRPPSAFPSFAPANSLLKWRRRRARCSIITGGLSRTFIAVVGTKPSLPSLLPRARGEI